MLKKMIFVVILMFSVLAVDMIVPPPFSLQYGREKVVYPDREHFEVCGLTQCEVLRERELCVNHLRKGIVVNLLTNHLPFVMLLSLVIGCIA